MRRVIRDNPLLVVSIALPVAVVLLFAAATMIPRLITDPPAYDLLLSVQSGDSNRTLPVRIDVGVAENRVVARVLKPGEYQPGILQRVFRYSHESRSVREVNIPIPADAESLLNGQIIPIPELEGVKVSADLRAPDGYEYRGQNGHGGFMLDLFGAARSSRKIKVSKDGAVVPIRLPESDYWYYGTQFLGWVIAEE